MPDKDKTFAVATPTAPAPAVGTPGIPAASGAPGTPGVPGAPGAPTIPPRRSPGHRGADVKDTVAEMAAKAHEISLEAGSKMAAAMKDVVGAAAGLTGLVLESARDLLQYMVRRGQMTQEEADKLMREVEASHAKRKPFTPPPHVAAKAPAKVESSHSTHTGPSTHVSHVSHAAHPTHSAPARHAASTHKPATKHAAAKKPVAKKTTMKPAAKKHVVKSASKSKPKASGKTAKKR
jgi:polyhydroxyalkanoate synthesis regulator phasin